MRQYSESVPYEVSSTTVRAVAADSRASVSVASGDADFAVVAHRGPLVVTVTAEDGTAAAYVVEVVRAGPLALSTASVDGAGVVLVYDEGVARCGRLRGGGDRLGDWRGVRAGRDGGVSRWPGGVFVAVRVGASW